MSSRRNSLVSIHIAVILFGFSGLFGKLVTLPAPAITFGRALVAAIMMMCVLLVRKHSLLPVRRMDYLVLAGSGLLLAIHWIAFFYAIQISTVAAGLLGCSTFPVFALLIEPLVCGERLRRQDIAMAFMTVLGVMLVIPKVQISNTTTEGVLVGIMAGCAFGALSVFNRKVASREEYPSAFIVCYQMAFAALFAAPLLFIAPVATYSSHDLVLLAVLGVLFTAASHMLFVHGMARVKAQVATTIASLEPLYGIILAVPLLHEVPASRAVAGGVVILAAAFWATSGKAGIKSAMSQWLRSWLSTGGRPTVYSSVTFEADAESLEP